MTATDPRPGTVPPAAGHTDTDIRDGTASGSSPSAGQGSRRTSVPLRSDLCPSCRAWRAACYCAADVNTLRYFAREMTELHMPTGTDVCGCGSRNCVYRSRLAKIIRAPGTTTGRNPA